MKSGRPSISMPFRCMYHTEPVTECPARAEVEQLVRENARLEKELKTALAKIAGMEAKD